MRSKHDFPSVNTKTPDGIKPNGIPYKVVVIEPHEFLRKQIIQILESEGYEILASGKDGQDGVDIMERIGSEVDIITTDLDMPRLDGYAFLYNVKEKNYKAKVVFISNDTTKGVLKDLLTMGASDFILKPIKRIRLLERMKMLTDKIK
ncbi:MAG: response regulator [Spirochaetes bacterium]|nr:response regulator [Spirochaetota bacterium]MBN2772306.1 response regulator [Spirochaetota bacterium]HRX16341.1 response regulator [Spirochaetota bacterium]